METNNQQLKDFLTHAATYEDEPTASEQQLFINNQNHPEFDEYGLDQVSFDDYDPKSFIHTDISTNRYPLDKTMGC